MFEANKEKEAMAKAIENPLPDVSAWITESLRLTAFHRLGPQQDDRRWWEAIAGADPESKNLKPREGGFEITGPYSGAVLTLKADLLRFDWLLTAAFSLDKPAADFPTIGPFPKALQDFLPGMNKWLTQAPPIFRLAFGAVVLQPVEDRISGYKALAPYLSSVELDPDNSSEFSYSINRHRKAEAFEGMHINRLSRWSVGHFQAMMVAMVVGQGARTDAVPGKGLHALRVELDINTDPTRNDPLPKDKLPALFDYLVSLGQEILAKGDKK